MQLVLNSNMQYIDTDDGLVILDSEEQVHYIDSTGKNIIRMIETESRTDIVFEKFCALYTNVSTDQLSVDFAEFLEKLMAKGILIYGI